MTNLRVASVQFSLRRETSLDTHIAEMDRLVAQAVAGGAEVVVFPEFSSMGLLGAIDDHEVIGETVADDYREFLAPLFPEISEQVRQLAQRYRVTVLGGSHNRIAADGSLRNTAILAHPDGRVELQDKIHLTPPEHAMGAIGGDEMLVTKIGAFTVGVLICADVQFPELARHLVARGVDLILCPSLTWNRRGVYRVRTGCSARAIENQCYVVMSPLVGSSGLPADAPMYAVGRSIVTTPVDKTFGLNDGVLAQAHDDSEEIIFADLDHAVLIASRERPEAPGLKLQRPELYAKLREVVNI
ncbi:putative amidohydrolase [Leucobacter exalbidus]|uniref:Amidohydrolase n=1 Tax=Leucobacter exalbidus TaxID=662960 RepID=A0A940PPA5_9MICO|nr:nitrilase-related carbon-nitrogen hydrolase [Leucobacter exalbidus]MBP1326695.1 putative amidohydrolase [Leucobacter exalbidus]